MSRSTRISIFAFFALAVATAAGRPACAAPQIYRYEIESRTYGNIGTYTNIVTHIGDKVDVRTKMHVTIRFLGFPVYRQDANRLERWRDGRMIAFRSDTDDDGAKIDVTGKAKGDRFVVKTPTGTIIAPAAVRPTNPWVPVTPGTGSLMSTKTGKVVRARVISRGKKTVTFGGRTMHLWEFFIDSDKHQVMWVNDRGVAVALQTPQHGLTIRFVLKNPHAAVAAEQVSQQTLLASNSNVS